MSLVSRAFSLIELLVVVAIIGVLVGLLLPSLSAARSASKQMACSANMRGVSQALVTYVQDFEYVPPLDYSNGANFPGQPDLRTRAVYNESCLAALSDSATGEGGYLRTKTVAWSATATNLPVLTGGNVLYCPAMVAELQVKASSQGVGTGGVLPVAVNPTSDDDPRIYQGIVHQQVLSSLATGKNTGIQSWYGTCGATSSGNVAPWLVTPIRRIVGDLNISQNQGVKYGSIPNPSKLAFLKEGGSSNQNLGISIYRISAPHGVPGSRWKTNIAFFDGHVDNFRRSDIYPLDGNFSLQSCQQIKESGLAWRMDQ